tara:strand:- start:721 stop:1095 length:375 start_codon:yes stop_codon:yes gene_type:complete
MKITSKLWSITFLCLAMLSCSASQKSTSNTNGDHVDFIATFFSKGAGIDRRVYAKFKAFLTDSYPTLGYSETTYGREGETSFCFDLSTLKKKEKEGFSQEAKLILSKSETVKIQENSTCKHLNK